MAGRPKMRALETTLSEKPEGEDWVFEQLADGCTVGDVADMLGVSRRMMYNWRDSGANQERRRELWKEAIKISADVDADLIGEEFDRLDRVIAVDDEGNPVHRIPHSAEVQLATGRAKYRKWRAACKHPDKYGKQGNQVNVQVNVGDAHLETLKRSRQLRPRNPGQVRALPVGDDPEQDDGGPDYETVE